MEGCVGTEPDRRPKLHHLHAAATHDATEGDE